MHVFENLESQVRSYCRAFPEVFTKSRGSFVFSEGGKSYLDFFSGAGTLNYGHNNPRFKRRLIEYIENDGIAHSLDMATGAKRAFLERFQAVILGPRGLNYKIQFPGPTGTNAVEAALKLARKVTGRQTVVYFTNAYHGMTLGALAVTGNAAKRAGAGVPLLHTVAMPYDGYFGEGQDTLEYLRRFLDDSWSGLDRPAAVIVETVQAEGGVNPARREWLVGLERLLKERGILFIVDDIQVGCGRTGSFFSFEPFGLRPDMVCLSKSISGYGLPMALVLIRPELDIWEPGEHNGTFRGNNLAFITAAEALAYWEDDALEVEVLGKGGWVRERLLSIAARHPQVVTGVRGRGLIQGLAFVGDGLAAELARAAFERGLLIESVGPGDAVLKLLPPLVIEPTELEAGLGIIEESLEAVLARVKAVDVTAVA
jgi:diaminobutyrate-2-oxoglutarate transaminase